MFLSKIILTVLASTTILNAQSLKPIDIGTRPESLTRGFDGHLFVTVMGEKKPGDAVIKRIHKDGTISIFSGGFDEPKGIAFVGDMLVVSDLGRVWAIDSNGVAKVLAHRGSFPEEIRYLNDVAAVPGENAVYVTDMGSNHLMFESPGKLWPLNSDEAKALPSHGRVYKINLSGEVTKVVPTHPDMRNPNGVGVGLKGEILVAGFFTGKISAYQNDKLSLIAEGFRGADAIEQDKDGVYYISSWTQGKVWSYDPKTKKTTVLKEGQESAADFFFDRKARQIICPDMVTGLLHTISLNK